MQAENLRPRRQLSDLPGPRGLPVLGNLLALKGQQMHQTLEAWARQYGPYFCFKILGYRILAVADHEAVAALSRDRPEGFRRAARGAQVVKELGFDVGVFFANGDAWSRQRRMVMAGLDPAHMREYFPSLVKVAQRLEGRWRQAARDGAVIDLQSDLMRYTVDVISGLAFGADVNTLESDADVIQRHLDLIFPSVTRRMLSAIPYWKWFKLPSDRRLDDSIAQVNAAVRGFIADARARLAAEPDRRQTPRNLLEAMVVAAEQADSGISEAEIAGNVWAMLLAGEDTTANTTAWLIYMLTRNPAALARAQAEVRAVLGDGSVLDHARLANLDFLEACIHETLRLRPVVPMLSYQASRDTVLGDVAVPRGTVVWTLYRHDTLQDRFFPAASDFNPERWLVDEGPAKVASAAKRVSMPFGAGPRVCPGRYLALTEVKMAMAMLLSRFDIVSVDTPDAGDVRERVAVTMYPDGLQMRLKAR